MAELRWGVLSSAKIAREKVIPGIARADRCTIVAIASRDLERARAVAAQAGIPVAHGSYEALLADRDVDAVYIPLPNHLHAEWVIAAARAGKHVLCEKPLALTAADAERMIEACEAEGVRLMEAFMYRLHPSWVAVRELVASGRIGRLVAVQCWFSYYNDEPANI
ncbi:MAG: Gfo/Idh/MocA family protein, partial [Candidatus Limnocylindrales bacterium]